MFDFLLKPFSPLTTFYNSLVVVNCAFFQQFEIKQLSYDPIQADQIAANYNYDPFAGQDAGDLVMTDIEEDYTSVDKLTEDVDDDYCLTHRFVQNCTVNANGDSTAAAAAAPDTAADTATDTAAEAAAEAANDTAPAHLVSCLRVFVANVIENITCSFVFGALLSCDFVLSEKRSIEGFVKIKSGELKNCRPTNSRVSSSSSSPRMRGFGVDFGVPSVKFGEFATVPDTDAVASNADFVAVVPTCSRWQAEIKDQIARRREAYIRFNREHEELDGWGFIRNDFSILAAN